MTKQEIEQMSGLITNLIIDKFLAVNMTTCKCKFFNDEISFKLILKERYKKDGEREYESILSLTIHKENEIVVARIKELSYLTNIYGSATSKYENKVYGEDIKVTKYWNIFLGKRNRDIRKKIKDFFEYKENKKEYDELKEVIDNHLDNKSLRKLKLENLKNNS